MMKALFTAATGMDAQQTRIAVISNNIANVNTTGFKQGRAEFEDLLYETKQLPGSEAATGINTGVGLQIGSGTRVVSTQNDFSQGTPEATSSNLDVTIEGTGFFQVALPDGTTAYTRAGSFTTDPTGILTTQNGFKITPPITIPVGAQNVKIATDGTVSATQPPATTVTTLGTIQTATFPNQTGLSLIGKNLFSETTASGSPQVGNPGSNGSGSLQSGFLESSNVNIADELIHMILAQRAYELNGKVIQTADQMLQNTNQLR